MAIKTSLARLAMKIVEWVNKRKGWVAVGALALLVVALVVLRNPMMAVGAAIAAGALVLAKEILAALGKAKEADELASIAEKEDADLEERRKMIANSRRTFDVWSSICGMFAAIAGVPAAVAVIEKLIQ